MCGNIVTVSHAWVAGTTVSFALNNLYLTPYDIVNLGPLSGSPSAIVVCLTGNSTGTIVIYPLASTTSVMNIRFSIIKGVNT
jgi:hypothetical protein